MKEEKWIADMGKDSALLSEYLETQRQSLVATAAKFINSLAEDCVQDATIKAMERFASFKGVSEPQLIGWMRKIVVNECLSRLRRKGNQNIPLSSYDKADSTVESPSLNFRRAEELEKLTCGLAELSERERDAVTYHFLLGLSVNDTADVMDETKGAVQGLLFRGVKKLGKMLTESQFSIMLKK